MTDVREQALRSWLYEITSDQSSDLISLNGDASFRRYFRFGDKIAVDSPPATQKNAEFIRINAELKEISLRVPTIFNYDLEKGFMLLEDLGSTHFYQVTIEDKEQFWYEKALLVANQIPKIKDPKLPPFDQDFILMELGIFTQWLIQDKLKLSLSEYHKSLFKDTFDFLVKACLAMPKCAMHRDFHCRNLMVVDNELAVIDYQDMVKGPYAYDLASLLYDCYVVLPSKLREELSSFAYSHSYVKDLGISFERFVDDIRLCAIQRHIKVLGIFTRLYLRDGKDNYLKDMPRVLNYLLDNCAYYPKLKPFLGFLEQEVVGKI